MPWTYDVDANGIMIFSGIGEVTEADLRAGAAAATTDTRFETTTRFLVDYGQATSIQLTVDAVRSMAQSPWWKPHFRRAFYASTDLGYGMGRMYQAFAQNQRGGVVEVFRDRDQAIAWLLR